MKPLEIAHDERARFRTPGEGAPPRALSLRVNFSWTLAGNIVYAGCQWAMLVVLARLGRAEMVGQFALGLAITAPVLMCTNLNLRSVQATDAKREYRFADYFSLRLLTTMIAMPLIAGIAFFSGYRGVTLAVILLLGLSKCCEALSDIFYGLLQQNEQMRPIAISMMLKGSLSLVALATSLYVTGSLALSVAAICIVWALVLTLYDVPQGLKSGDGSTPAAPSARFLPRTARPVAMRLAWLSAPMGMVMFLISLNGNLPRYFVEQQMGLHQLGIFAAILYLMTAGGTVVGALGQSATPRLANLYASGKFLAFGALLWKLAAISTLIGLAGMLVAALAGGPILELLYGAEYSRHGALFVAIMTVAWLSYLGSLLGYGMSAARCFRVQAPIYLASLIATLLGCVLLIPHFQLRGAALAVGAGTVIQIIAGLLVMFLALRREAAEFGEGAA